MNEFGGGGCVPLKIYLQKQRIGWIWPAGHSLLSPDLKHKWKILKARNQLTSVIC